MFPNDWPGWVRDTAPAWVVLAVFLWLLLRRYLDIRDHTRKPLIPAPYGRPTRDPRIICPTVGFVAVSIIQIATGPTPGTINTHLQWLTQVGLALVLIFGGALTIAGAYVRSEYWSIGVELAGCILLAGALLVYCFGYATTVPHWAAAMSIIYTGSLMVGNVLRAIQLLRRVG